MQTPNNFDFADLDLSGISLDRPQLYADPARISADLARRALEVAQAMLPEGRRDGAVWVAACPLHDATGPLRVIVEGPAIGSWTDGKGRVGDDLLDLMTRLTIAAWSAGSEIADYEEATWLEARAAAQWEAIARGWSSFSVATNETGSAEYEEEPYELLQFAHELKLPTGPRWLVEGILLARGIACLIGPSNTGKTFLAVDLSLSTSAATSFHGRAVKPGRVVYIAGEGADDIPARVKAWEIEHGLVGRVGHGFALVQEPIHFDMANPHSLERLETLRRELHRSVARHGPISLIVIDTLSSCLTTDENDNQAIAAFIRALHAFRREFGAAVLINHHPPKGTNGARGTALSRGASAFVNNVDAGLYFERKRGVSILSNKVKEPRDAAPGQPMAFATKLVALPPDDEGNPRDSLVLVSRPLPKGWNRADDADEAEEDDDAPPPAEHTSILDHLREHGPLDWRSIMATLQPTRDEARRKRLERARKQLLGTGAIRQTGDKRWALVEGTRSRE